MPDSKGVLPAIIGALSGAAIAAAITGLFNLSLERQKADNALVLEIVKVGDDAQRASFVAWLTAHDLFNNKGLQDRLAADAIAQPQTGEPIPSTVPSAAYLKTPVPLPSDFWSSPSALWSYQGDLWSTTRPSSSPTPAATSTPAAIVPHWGVVIGAYDDLQEATRKLTAVRELGYTDAAIYKRGRFFQLGIPAPTLSDAQSAAGILLHKGISKTPQVLDIHRWCPHPKGEDGYFECAPNIE